MMTETVVTVQEAPNNNAAPNKQQTASADSPLSWIKLNVDYFKTTPGVLKIVELILGILCMSLASPAYHGGVHFFLFVATTSFIGTLIWVFIYLLGIREAISFPINWILTELLNTGICAVFYIIAFIVELIVSIAHLHGSYIAAGVFGLLNAAAYSFATYLLNVEHKSSRAAN
ncbi:CKLF-like MARVEL transmembrane domain-containing protein 4 [Anoplophora glabripennis]|uniref:CKLF-like MARVEL transmembrane domain-containing protein 4 n=1 Tax=Anoplophora glabripennis TaxID=217634 RepID=UPI0008734E52|nr:CKLF-like MARVEL transmembrane domain-containing protein 4 [Anoplophora glabripennis]